MREAGYAMDGLGLHYYTRIGDKNVTYMQEDGNEIYIRNEANSRGSATEFDEQDWFKILAASWKTQELIDKHSTIMDRYDPDKRVALIIDEWGTWFDNEPGTNPGFLYQQNTLRDAVSAAIAFNIFNNRAERVKMTNIAQTINVLQAMVLTEGAKMVLTPSYHVFDLYKEHQDGTLLPTAVDCPDYSYGSENIPGLSVSASKSKDGKLVITLANPDPSNGIDLAIETRAFNVKSISGRILSSANMQDYNDFNDGEKVKPESFTGAEIKDGMIRANVPAKSVIAVICS
jgi:alpha-N-arabinofuranosidase